MKNRAGLAVGLIAGLGHAAWSALVALGLAQRLLDFVLWLHFLSVPVAVEPFSLGRALGLVGLTFATGYVTGWLLAWAWNALRAPEA